ncbi:hypothetical protein ACJX0J_034695 [Zea mays]
MTFPGIKTPEVFSEAFGVRIHTVGRITDLTGRLAGAKGLAPEFHGWTKLSQLMNISSIAGIAGLSMCHDGDFDNQDFLNSVLNVCLGLSLFEETSTKKITIFFLYKKGESEGGASGVKRIKLNVYFVFFKIDYSKLLICPSELTLHGHIRME